jgi:hypothetical protein
MAVQSPIHEHTALQVYQVALLPLAQVGLVEGFLDSRYPVAVIYNLLHGQANPVMGDALVYLKFLRNRTAEPEAGIGARRQNGLYLADGFYDARKHAAKFDFLGLCFDISKIQAIFASLKSTKGGIKIC